MNFRHGLYAIVVTVFSIGLTDVQAEEIEVTVDGMVCSFCAQGIHKKLSAHPSVETVEVTLEDRLVKFSTREETVISDSEIEEIIKDAGYTVRGVKREVAAP